MSPNARTPDRLSGNPFDGFDPLLAGPPALAPTDVSYVVDDTSIGRMLFAVTSGGSLVTSAYVPDTVAEERWLLRLAASVSPRVLRHPGPTDDARRALAAYLAGRTRAVDVRTDLALASPFQRRVLGALVERVGYGERTTYAALASSAQAPGAARAVGTALGGNPLCVAIPCHRVLPASGGVGGYAGGPAAKQHLLTLEATHHPG
ncbi:MAG: methylated-DNA--[protein]-cysteine S-methyltransferase [Dermatophilaceae bacterium]